MTQPITIGQVRSAAGGLRLHGSILAVGWTFTPSIGIIAKDIDKLGLDISNFREPLTRSITKVMIPSIGKNFDVGGRPSWPPLAEFTVERRGSSQPILIRTGALRGVATSLGIWDIGDASATIRSLPQGVWYGALHQAGFGGFGGFMSQARAQLPGGSSTEVNRRAFELMDAARGGASGQRPITIPQRRFILFQDQDVDDIKQIFFEWLGEKVEEAEFR